MRTITTRQAPSRRAPCAAAALVTALALATISSAETAPDFVLDAGVACQDFALGVSVKEGKQELREFLDRSGNVVRWITTGKGAVLIFTNMTSGEELTIKTRGSVTHVTVNPDGSQTHTSTGHNVWILFDTDFPAGPSTTLYVGKVVFEVDPQSNITTLQSTSGQQVDICAALA